MFDDKTEPAKVLAKGKEIALEAMGSDLEWQREAQDDFNFRDGNQWPDAEKEQLEEDRRPVLTFNVTKASIDLVKGLNDDVKVRYRANPVKKSDEFACEIINRLVYWAYEANDWDEIEDEVFESAAISGRGWLGIDFGPDPKQYGSIKLSMQHIPVREVFIDPASRDLNLEDASYIVWDKWLTVEDFRIKYPNAKYDPSELMDFGMIPLEFGDRPDSPIDLDPFTDSDLGDYDAELDDNFYDKQRRQVRLIHIEYWKNYECEWVRNPTTGIWNKLEDYYKDKKEWEAYFKRNYPEIDPATAYSVVMDKRVYWLQFVAHEILYHGPAPVPYDGFSVIPCFAYRDVSRKTNKHFGVVRLMKDAQREINKRWSQTLNLINNQVQPGLYAEIDAFVDREQAEESIKNPGDITFLEPGAIAKKKLQERSIPQFPSATFNMEEQAQVMLRRITGINPDLLGQDRGRQEPGVVVKMRQQQGLVILRPLFNSYKRMKREIFKRQVSILLKWMPLQQMQRILGDRYKFNKEEGMTIITNQEGDMKFNLDAIRDIDYVIDLEETSASMTQRMFELSAMTEMQQAGIPADPRVMISKMDLPATDKRMWIDYVNGQQEAASQQAQQQMELEMFKVKSQHEREMLRTMLEAQSKSDKTMAQIAKDAVAAKNALREIGIKETDTMLDFIAKMANVDENRQESIIEAATDIAVANINAQASKDAAKNKPTGGSNE